MNVCCRFLASWQLKIASAWRAATDEHCVVIFGKQRVHRLDALATFEGDAEIEDVARLFIDHRLRQAKAWNLGADEATRFRLAIKHRDVIAERRQIAGNGERRGSRADARDALAIFRGQRGHSTAYVVFHVGGNPFESTDRNRFGSRTVVLFYATASARGLARTVTGAPQNAGEHVRRPVDHVGVAVATLRDQADVFGNGSVSRTGPLTIDDLVEIGRIRDIRTLQVASF